MIILIVNEPKKQKANETVLKSFMDKITEIDKMLSRLVEAYDDHQYSEELHREHVDSMTDVASNVKEIVDSVFKDGMYAE